MLRVLYATPFGIKDPVFSRDIGFYVFTLPGITAGLGFLSALLVISLITLLPVFGAIWMPTDMLRFDLAFPRPRVAIRVMDDETWIYLGGELGGST